MPEGERSLAQQTPTTQSSAIEVRVGGHTLAEIVDRQLWKSDELAKVANITFPITALDVLPPNHVPSLSVIRVNPDPKAGDVYAVGGQLALRKHVLLKIANAGGIHIRTRKVSPRHDLDNIEWEAIAFGRLPDGTPISVKCSKTWSWAKCQQEMKPAQAAQYRQFADEQTETKAILRAVRAGMNLKTGYTPEEIRKPFLVARAVFAPDMSDPEVRKVVLQSQLQPSAALYGPALDGFASLPTPTELVDDEPEEVQIEVQSAQPAEMPEPEPEPEPTPEPEPEEDDEDALAEDLRRKIRELARKPAEGGIGTKMRLVLERYGLSSCAGANVLQLRGIYEDAVAVLEGRLAL